MSEELSMMQGEDDSLANLRKSFSIPKKVIYLNGNSLGPLQFGVKQNLSMKIGARIAMQPLSRPSALPPARPHGRA